MFCDLIISMHYGSMMTPIVQALEVHGGAAGEAEGHEAMLATLQCMRALMSGTSGMRGVLGARGFALGVCALLRLPGEPEAAKLVVEMLIKLCLFSAEGYVLAVKVHPPAFAYSL